MKSKYPATAKVAKAPTEQVIGKSRTDHRWFAPVLKEFKRRFPHNTPAELAYRANRSVRICEVWISGKGAPDGAALNSLLNSDLGDHVWLAMTAGCKAPWASKRRAQIEISQIRDEQRDLTERLNAALERGNA